MTQTKLFRGVSLLLVVFALSTQAFAKRSEPAEPPAVTVDGTEYRAPCASPDHMGYIDARDAAGKLLWSRQIYVVVKDPELEGDVQDVYISKIERDGQSLVITNERGSIYKLDLKTLEVAVVKGAVRVDARHRE